MKLLHKIALYIGTGFFAFSMSSCSDWLEREDDGKQQEADVFARFDKVSSLVTQLYTDMYDRSQGLNLIYSHNIGTLSDEMESNKADSDAPFKILNGELSSDPSTINGVGGGGMQWWWRCYQSIRKANKIIDGVEKYGTPDHPNKPGLLNQRIGEAYFFRVYYHYLVLRWHGEVVYSDRIYSADEDPATYAIRESVHTSVEKMCRDLDVAAGLLPINQVGEEFNRIDKGTCFSLKAIIRWIAAQPLYNGGMLDENGNPTGVSPLGSNDTRIGAAEYKVYDKTRWDKARDAAAAVVNLADNGVKRYSLYKNYSKGDFIDKSGGKVYTRLEKMFIEDAFYNKEAVLTLIGGKDTRWIQDNIPLSYGSGQTRNQPTQEQVDQYEYIDSNKNCGFSIFSQDAKDSGYSDTDPYIKRDPRFYRDIVYVGATLMGKEYNTATGSDKLENTSARDSRSTRTGYALRKFIQNDWTTNAAIVNLKSPLIRLPEIMLIYAEALNETDGNVTRIKQQVNDIRDRSFMAPVPAAFDTDKKVRRQYIERERRVELFFENNRYFTLRYKGVMTNPVEVQKETTYLALDANPDLRAQKWTEQYGEYPQTQHYIHGMMPVENANGKIIVGGKKYVMKRFEGKQLAPRRVTYRDYFFPINSNECAKTPTILQNPGW